MQQIVDRIIAELDNGIVPWKKPWNMALTLPRNLAGRTYRGMNILILWGAAQDNLFARHIWGTYLQVQEYGGQVLAKSRGTRILHFSIVEKEEERVPIARWFNVFNVGQTEGIPLPEEKLPSMADVSAFVESLGVSRTQSPIACYVPSQDAVGLPPFDTFDTEADFWATYLHEIAHWTGPRLGRPITTRADPEGYAFEELVAELSSAFLCAQFQIAPIVRHADYIGGWLKALKNDRKYFFRAASLASKVYDYLGGVYATRLQSLKGPDYDGSAPPALPSDDGGGHGGMPVLSDQQGIQEPWRHVQMLLMQQKGERP